MKEKNKSGRCTWRYVDYLVIFLLAVVGSFFLHSNVEESRVFFTREWRSMKKSQNVVAFYNIYVNPETPNLARRIIKEQLQKFENSSYANQVISTINYVLIGDTTFQMPPCSTCKELARFSSGSEGETLSRLYEHCLRNDLDVVVYFHTKGSFHERAENELLRNFAMEGITSKDCLTHMDQCDVCSSRFSPYPHAHTSGNMWVAHCSYIKRLRRPENFEKLMYEAHPNIPKGDVAERADVEQITFNQNERILVLAVMLSNIGFIHVLKFSPAICT